jgi:regulator of replication initiation timing
MFRRNLHRPSRDEKSIREIREIERGINELTREIEGLKAENEELRNRSRVSEERTLVSKMIIAVINNRNGRESIAE